MRSFGGTAILLVLVLVLVAGACSVGQSADGIGEVASVRGRVEVIRGGETLEVVETDELRAGDVVSAAQDSIARLSLVSGSEVELHTARLRVIGEDVVELEQGSALVVSMNGTELRAGNVVATVDSGRARFDLGKTLRVGAYDVDGGSLAAVGDEVELEPYWQVVYGEDGVATEAGPLQFTRRDAIDRRLLAVALQIDSDLSNLLRGLEPQLAAAAGSPVIVRAADQGVDPATVAAFSDSARADLLVALAFARQESDALPPDVSARFGLSLYLRSLGATWGLLAQQFSLDGDTLLSGLEEEIAAVLFPPAEGEPGGGDLLPRPQPLPPSAGPAPAPPAPAPPAVPPPPPEQPEPAESPPPGSDPPPGLLPEELVRIVDELFGLVDNLL